MLNTTVRKLGIIVQGGWSSSIYIFEFCFCIIIANMAEWLLFVSFWCASGLGFKSMLEHFFNNCKKPPPYMRIKGHNAGDDFEGIK